MTDAEKELIKEALALHIQRSMDDYDSLDEAAEKVLTERDPREAFIRKILEIHRNWYYYDITNENNEKYMYAMSRAIVDYGALPK